MELPEERIQKDGIIEAENILKAGSFLNHQMDVSLFQEMGKEFHRLFSDRPVNKILTIMTKSRLPITGYRLPAKPFSLRNDTRFSGSHLPHILCRTFGTLFFR